MLCGGRDDFSNERRARGSLKRIPFRGKCQGVRERIPGRFLRNIYMEEEEDDCVTNARTKLNRSRGHVGD